MVALVGALVTGVQRARGTYVALQSGC
jgi:hypothetical protein